MADDIQSTVKEFILNEFLPGEDPNELQPDTPLVTGGILDSLATLKLVSYLEHKFGIEVQAHEAGPDNLDSIADIAALVERKRAGK